VNIAQCSQLCAARNKTVGRHLEKAVEHAFQVGWQPIANMECSNRNATSLILCSVFFRGL